MCTQKAREDDEIACKNLIVSCNDEVSFRIVQSAATSDNLSGNESTAWDELNDKHNLSKKVTKTQLKKITESKLSFGQKPDEHIRSLEKTSQIKSL